MEDAKVRAITHSLDVVKVVLLGVPDRPGVAALVLRTLADCAASLDMIIQSEGREGKKDIAFVVPREDEGKIRKALEDLRRVLSFEDVTFDEGVGKVSVVGAGVASDPRIAFRMFDTLARLGVNIDMISTSNLRISCLIPKDRVTESVRALHETFIEDSEVTLREGS